MGNRLIIKNLIFLVLIVFAIWWVAKILSNPPATPCNFTDLRIGIPLKIQEAITMDGGQNTLLTRFFHNKPLFYSTGFTQCYLKYFDLNFLLSILSPFGFLFSLLGFYHFLKNWNHKLVKILLIIFLLAPIVNISEFYKNLSIILFMSMVWITSLYGLWLLWNPGRQIRTPPRR